jgi:hypothetical protein
MLSAGSQGRTSPGVGTQSGTTERGRRTQSQWRPEGTEPVGPNRLQRAAYGGALVSSETVDAARRCQVVMKP